MVTNQMDSFYRATLIVLVSIAAIGLIAIPLGNPIFIDRAIILELSSVILLVLIRRGYSKAMYVSRYLSYLLLETACSTTC
jgi:uncharacterized membrane protein